MIFLIDDSVIAIEEKKEIEPNNSNNPDANSIEMDII